MSRMARTKKKNEHHKIWSQNFVKKENMETSVNGIWNCVYVWQIISSPSRLDRSSKQPLPKVYPSNFPNFLVFVLATTYTYHACMLLCIVLHCAMMKIRKQEIWIKRFCSDKWPTQFKIITFLVLHNIAGVRFFFLPSYINSDHPAASIKIA